MVSKRDMNWRRLLPAVLLMLPVAAVAEPQPGDISQRLDRIERLLEGQALLEMHDQLQRLQSEVRQLRGEIETQQRRLESMNERLEIVEAMPVPEPVAEADDTLSPLADLDALDEEMPSLEGDDETIAMLPPLADDIDDPMVTDEEVAAVADYDPAEARAAYNRAFDLLKEAQYEAAISALKAYLRDYPGSDDAGNAQYWLGEAYFVMRDYEQAIEAYQTLINNYPGSSQVPQARLKIGYSQHELGDIASARDTLQNVRQSYAGSTVARLAEDRLQQIAETN